MDLLHIHDFTATTTIGIHSWEKAVQQTIKLDIDLACDCAIIAQSDHIDHAYDYDAITQTLTTYLHNERTELIETLVDKLAHYLHELTQTSWLKIKLTKPGAIKAAKTIAVTIERDFTNKL